MISAMLIGAVLWAQIQAPVPSSTQTQVQMGVVVRPETVTVGQHFAAIVRVRTPRGTTLQLPGTPSDPAHVDSAGPIIRHDTVTAQFAESVVTYILAAWAIGPQRLGFGDVVAQTERGEQHISLANASVFVRSVLPKDTTLHKAKPPRPLIEVRPFNWWPWIIAAIIALASLLAWLVWRWLQQRRNQPVSPLTWAEREFRRIEGMQLIDKQPEQHAILMAGVVREYLIRQFPVARASATTRELAHAVRRERRIPRDRVIALLERVDLLKFARARVNGPEARTIGDESRAVVRDIDAALVAAQAAAAPQERAA